MTASLRAPLPIILRDSTPADIAAVQAIYAHYVTRSCASFEEVAPTVEEMAARRQAVLDRGLPWLVAECDGDVLGYTYAQPFRTRSAYRYTIEDSIYVAPMVVGRGVGRTLLSGLIERCTDLGYRRMIGVIGDSANTASINVHRACGFRQEGVLRGVGLKFGRWIDIVLMQRPLGPEDAPLPGDAQGFILQE